MMDTTAAFENQPWQAGQTAIEKTAFFRYSGNMH
jgi:hypothetical protein